MGPPLKIILFPVHRPGELISAEWIHFFSHFRDYLFCFQHFPHHFYIENKISLKKKILQPPDWPQLLPTAGQETNFFLMVAWHTGPTL